MSQSIFQTFLSCIGFLTYKKAQNTYQQSEMALRKPPKMYRLKLSSSSHHNVVQLMQTPEATMHSSRDLSINMVKINVNDYLTI